MADMTRWERRAQRRGRAVTVREARLAARLARLDYKTSGETGAITPDPGKHNRINGGDPATTGFEGRRSTPLHFSLEHTEGRRWER